jgi:hypothetical protein
MAQSPDNPDPAPLGASRLNRVRQADITSHCRTIVRAHDDFRDRMLAAVLPSFMVAVILGDDDAGKFSRFGP